MTFADARKKHMTDLDDAYKRLRAIVADPKWCNADYKEYKASLQCFASKLDRIRELNQAQVEAE